MRPHPGNALVNWWGEGGRGGEGSGRALSVTLSERHFHFGNGAYESGIFISFPALCPSRRTAMRMGRWIRRFPARLHWSKKKKKKNVEARTSTLGILWRFAGAKNTEKSCLYLDQRRRGEEQDHAQQARASPSRRHAWLPQPNRRPILVQTHLSMTGIIIMVYTTRRPCGFPRLVGSSRPERVEIQPTKPPPRRRRERRHKNRDKHAALTCIPLGRRSSRATGCSLVCRWLQKKKKDKMAFICKDQSWRTDA